MQYYVLVLEAGLAFSGGMTIPLMSEFLSYTQGDTDTKKQDCEQKAFKRLAKWLKAEFGHLAIMVLLDGLYPNGPIMELCRKNKWDSIMLGKTQLCPSADILCGCEGKALIRGAILRQVELSK
ncbi:MAG: hypothetical protein GY850_14540 [bacterium]|nr:hypothetical protein [bacterium]